MGLVDQRGTGVIVHDGNTASGRLPDVYGPVKLNADARGHGAVRVDPTRAGNQQHNAATE